MYSNGKSEVIVGKALKKFNIPRSKVVILTKIFNPVMDDDSRPAGVNDGPLVNQMGLSRKHIFEAVDRCLERLGTDYIGTFVHTCPTRFPFSWSWSRTVYSSNFKPIMYPMKHPVTNFRSHSISTKMSYSCTASTVRRRPRKSCAPCTMSSRAARYGTSVRQACTRGSLHDFSTRRGSTAGPSSSACSPSTTYYTAKRSARVSLHIRPDVFPYTASHPQTPSESPMDPKPGSLPITFSGNLD